MLLILSELVLDAFHSHRVLKFKFQISYIAALIVLIGASFYLLGANTMVSFLLKFKLKKVVK